MDLMLYLRLIVLLLQFEKKLVHIRLRLAGLVGNRTSKRDLIDKYVEACPMPVLEVLPLIEDIRVSTSKRKNII